MGKGQEKGAWGKEKGAWTKGHGHAGRCPSWAPVKGSGKGWGKPVCKGWVVGPAGVAAAATPARRRALAPLPPQTVVVVAAPYRGKGKGKGKGQNVQAAQSHFHVDSVTMPAAGIELRGGVTFFVLDVTAPGGAMWRVLRRYSHFNKLREDLAQIRGLFHDVKFPGKTLGACSGERLERRRQELEVWLVRTLETLCAEHAQSRPVWQERLRRFLADDSAVQLDAALAHAASVMPAPSAPPAMSEPFFASAPPACGGCAPVGQSSGGEAQESEDVEMLEVLVPTGVDAGQVLGVEVPGGAVVPLTVPGWAGAGASLRLQYSEATGALVIMS